MNGYETILHNFKSVTYMYCLITMRVNQMHTNDNMLEMCQGGHKILIEEFLQI